MSKRTIANLYGTSPGGEARKVRVVYESDYAEYIAEVTDNGKRKPDSDYFTADKADAIATAESMLISEHDFGL